MIEGSCHCGAARWTAPALPETLTSCNCSICRRNGALWAYYSPAQVAISGETKPYISGDRTLALHHCPTCGCTTHWTSLDAAYARMGVNARLLEPALIASIPIRRLDGADTWEFID